MKISVRKAHIEDIPAILEITREAFKDYVAKAGIDTPILALTETFDDIKDDIEKKEVFIACEDHYPIGSVRIEINSDNTAYLSRLSVRIKYQSAGVGKLLMDIVNKRLKELGVSKVFLHTAINHNKLLMFYCSLGFSIESISNDKGYARALMCK